jgi:AcrR family transcriptional regulator
MSVDQLTGVRDVPTGRRERRRLELRDRLFDTAVRLFVENGYEATTMDSIAEHADVARATVFNHFPQKARFLDEWGRRRRAHVVGMLERATPDGTSASGQLRTYLREMARLNQDSRRETAVLADAGARHGDMLTDPAVSEELARILKAGQYQGEIRPDADIKQAALLLAAGYVTTILRWSAANPPFDLAGSLDAMAETVLRGLLP